MIQLTRRALVACAIMAATLPPAAALAQTYPSKPVRVVVPFGPGGTVDVYARVATAKMSERLGQQFYIENVAGATGNIGTAQVAKAAPDGYTMLFAFSSHVVNPSLFAKLPYDPVADFEPVMLAVASTHVLAVHPSVAAKTMADLVAVIHASPGKFSYASGGAGTQGHLLAEQFRVTRKLDIVHVPFNGAGPAVGSIVGGHTPVGIISLASAAQQITAGQLRALAVTSKARSKLLPDSPTSAEAGFADIEGDTWVGVLLPAKTPKEIIDTVNRELRAINESADMQSRLAAVGFEPVSSTPQAFAKQIVEETETWRKMIQAAGIKLQ